MFCYSMFLVLVIGLYPPTEEHYPMTMTMTMTIFYSTIDIKIEVITYNSLENQIINWSGDYD